MAQKIPMESQKLAPLIAPPQKRSLDLSANATVATSYFGGGTATVGGGGGTTIGGGTGGTLLEGTTIESKVGRASPTFEQLKALRGDLVGLPAVLKEEVQARRYGDETRLLEVRDLSLKVERHLALEIKRRAEADKALQQHVDKRMSEIHAKMEKASLERMQRMQEAVEVITKTIGDVRRELQEEHERTAKLALELRHQAEHSVSDLKAALEQEKVSRLEKEAQLQLKLAEDILKTQEIIESEHKDREAAVADTRTEFMNLMKERETSDEHFRLKVLDDISCLKTAIRVETETRESVEEHLTQTIATVTDQIQTSLHTVVQA